MNMHEGKVLTWQAYTSSGVIQKHNLGVGLLQRSELRIKASPPW